MTINIVWNLMLRGKAFADILEEIDVFLDGRRYKSLEIIMARLIELSY